MNWDKLPDGDLIVTPVFGLTRLSIPSVTEDEWHVFLAEVVTPRLMEFTVFDGKGQYFNRSQGRVIEIQTKVLVVVCHKANGGDIDAIRQEYQRRFNQIAVGLTVVSGCAYFAPRVVHFRRWRQLG